MAAKIMINYNCPMCGGNAFYQPKPNVQHPNLEYVQTRRGLRQYFHTSCYMKMVHEHKYWTDI